MSSELKRNFARRHITWKIKNFTKENVAKNSVESFICSPDFDISLHDNKTKWQLELCPTQGDEEKKSLGIYLYWKDYNSTNFTVTLTSTKGRKVRSFIKRTRDEPEKGTGHGWSSLISHDDLFAESLIVDDVLTLEFEVTIVHKPSPTFIELLELLEDSKLQPLQVSKIAQNNAKLLNNKKFSDLVLICSDGHKIDVNKSVISVQCPSFAATVAEVMDENNPNHAKFEDIDFKTMLELLRFIYSGQISNIEEVDLELLVAANRFGIVDLKDMCVSSLMETFPEKGFTKVLKIADEFKIQDLKENIIDYIKCKRNRLQSSDSISFSLWQEIYSSNLESNRLIFENDAAELA